VTEASGATEPDSDKTPGSERTPDSHGVPGERLLYLVGIVDRLRTSCPWDRQQTHESLLKYLLEEAYEAAEAIEEGDPAALREEIGDVLFQVFFHARVASERPAAEGGFTIDDVADTLAAKLIRRHPHVFGSVSVSSADEVNANWEEIKKAERAAKAAAAGAGGSEGSRGTAAPSALDGVPFGQPALSLAAQLQRRAARAGFTFEDFTDPGGDRAADNNGAGDAEVAFGAELMRVVARARAAGVDPELALRTASRRFADWVRAEEQGTSNDGEVVQAP
jgi:XTP/dITP diphosphohydrolase